MSVADIEELLFRYDKLKSLGNSGSFDNWFNTKFRLARLFKWGPFHAFHRRTYDLPVARNQILGEIRITLGIMKRLHQINHLRTNKTDKESKQAIKTISEYLDTTSKPDNFLKKLTVLKFPASLTPGVLSLLFLHGQNDAAILVLIVIGVLSIPVALSFVSLELSSYILEVYWYGKCMENLDIAKLKKKIMEDLIQLNNKTFASLNDHNESA